MGYIIIQLFTNGGPARGDFAFLTLSPRAPLSEFPRKGASLSNSDTLTLQTSLIIHINSFQSQSLVLSQDFFNPLDLPFVTLTSPDLPIDASPNSDIGGNAWSTHSMHSGMTSMNRIAYIGLQRDEMRLSASN